MEVYGVQILLVRYIVEACNGTATASRTVNVTCLPEYYYDEVNNVCTLCPAGSYCPGNTTEPIPCPAGSYSSVTGSAVCIFCAAGTFAATTGNTECTACGPGYFSANTGSTFCTACAAGSFQALSGQASCLACPSGKYSDVKAAIECTNCPVNTYNDLTGQTECFACEEGSYSEEGSVACTVCPTVMVTNNSPVCSGGDAIFMLTGVDGAEVSYSINGGSTQTVLLTGGTATETIVNIDAIQTLQLISINIGNCLFSGSSTILVNPNLPVSVTITADPGNSICVVTSVTFTANAVNGGQNPSYQWMINGNYVGTNSPTYTNNSLVDEDEVSVMLTSDAVCAIGNPATSNTIEMDVNLFSAVGAISGTNFVIQNAPTTANVTFTGSSGTAPYTFTYHINGGTTQSISTLGMNNSVTVPHPNGTPGEFIYTLLSVTDVFGCNGAIDPLQDTVIITVIPFNSLPDMSPSIARPLNVSFYTGQTKEGYIQINNGGNGPTFGVTKIRISKEISNFTLNVSPTVTEVAGQSVVNNQCTYTDLGAFLEVTYPHSIPVGSNIKIGYDTTATGLTGSNGSISVSIINGTGGDSNNLNNTATRRFVIN